MNLYLIIFLRACYLVGGIASLFYISWYNALLGYIFVALCNGVAAHRYFSHNQFSVSPIGRIVLGFFATIGMYSPINYWMVQHKHHHRHSDKPNDLHSPNKGLWVSALLWPFMPSAIMSAYNEKASAILFVKANKDPVVNFYSTYFVLINIVCIAVLFGISYTLALAYLAGYLLDFIRIGSVNALCHLNLPGGYRNHDTPDSSHNNYLLGLITLGFAWHNNHHADAAKLDLRERWWEFDIEAMFAKLLTKVFSKL